MQTATVNKRRQVILASQSPRRKDLLEKMGVNFQIVPSSFDEYLDHARLPEEVAIELAFGKVREIARRFPEAVVIGSDTIVTINGEQLGKPADEADARATLLRLAGQMNTVTTSIVVVCSAENKELAEVVTSKVYFKPLDEQAIETYIQTGDWHDKAGSYGLQSGAAPLVDYIEGQYDAVLGLPTKDLAKLLQIFGIDSKPVEITSPVPIR